jgi:hypothetical protein
VADVAHKVFLHVGLPKTGTTYLQTRMWTNHEELKRQGILLPGDSNRQHLWASCVVREDPSLDRRPPQARSAWDRLLSEAEEWDGTAVITHEFFAAASADQAAGAVAAFGDADVHVVVTARDTLSLVTARWQEYIKNGATVPIDDYPETEETDPANEWDWGTLDLADVLQRWGAKLPNDHVHVLTLPRPDEPPETLWLRFADLLGIDPAHCRTSGSRRNESLGVVEVELLRRVNAELEDFTSPLDRGNWIRGYLAQGKLLPRKGDKFWPSPGRIAELRARGNRIVDAVAAGEYDVIGDLEDLRPADVVPERRHPDSVTDTEVAAASVSVIAHMMADVRRLSQEKRALTQRVVPPPAPPPRPARRVRDRLGRIIRRLRRS